MTHLGLGQIRLAQSMMGLETPSVRFQELGHLATLHLRRLARLPGMSEIMVQLGMNRWKISSRPPKFRTELKRLRLKRLEHQYGRRAKLITNDARTKSGTDRALTLKSLHATTAMIAWRRGVWGAGRFEICVCGREYLFYHFQKCTAVSPPVRSMMVEHKLQSDDVQEDRLVTLFEQWEAQLTRAQLNRTDDGYKTPREGVVDDDEGWSTPGMLTSDSND